MGGVTAGDVVQITSETHHWFGALIVVTEGKSFGCQGFAPIPHNDGSGTGQAFTRLKADDYKLIGRTALELAAQS